MRTTGFREREAFRNFCILEKTPFRNCAISDKLSILLGVFVFCPHYYDNRALLWYHITDPTEGLPVKRRLPSFGWHVS